MCLTHRLLLSLITTVHNMIRDFFSLLTVIGHEKPKKKKLWPRRLKSVHELNIFVYEFRLAGDGDD